MHTFSGRLASLFLLSSLVLPGASEAAGPAGQARALGEAISRIIEGGATLAPFASVKFCVKNSDQCKSGIGPKEVQLTSVRRAQLDRVNTWVNRAIKPKPDPKGSDVWSVDVAEGDCEEYALTKRKRLIELGWPVGALRIAVTITTSGEGHAVLVVKSNEGDLVMDNRHSSIRVWKDTDLRWVKMQSGDNPRRWVSLTDHQNGVLLVSAQ